MDLFKTQPCKYFMLWFNFLFGLNFIFLCCEHIIKHYHTQKHWRKIKFKPEIKLNHNIYMDWGNPIQDWRVNCTNSKILYVRLYDCNHLAHEIVLWQMQTVQLLTAFFFFNLMAIFDYKTLQGLVLEGRFIGGFLALQIWGAYTCIWRGVYMEGLIFGILW